MTTAITLVTTSTPRPVLTIVKALQLDSVVVPVTDKSSGRAAKKARDQPAANNGNTQEGGRNNMLTSLAGSMRRRGMSESAIDAALQAENLTRFQQPLEHEEVSAIASSMMRYPAPSADEVMKSLTDAGNAARFGTRHKDLVRYVFGLGWVLWDELRWRRDCVEHVIELAKETARDIYFEGEALGDDAMRVSVAKHAKTSQQAPRLKAMVDLARSLPELVTQAELLDAHDMLLGVANGVVNLKTGKLQAARREDLMTRCCPVAFDADAKCPLFETFIDQVTDGDKALAQYLQRVVGYSLTGLTTEQCLFFLYGDGANGKSTFLNVLREMLGADYAKQTPSETLMARRTSATNDIARLQSIRVVIANEVEDGSLLAESLVKQMTGGEALTARFHYTEFFELTPKFKLFIAGNHKPMIRGRDNGIWRRMRLVPFVVTISPRQQDKHLLMKLRAELSGILNWAIKGCGAWQKTGLAEPKVITDAVHVYREEMDVIGQWVSECCTVAANLECKASEAYRSYNSWAEQNGYKPMSAGTFGRDFACRYLKVKCNDGNYFQGLAVDRGAPGGGWWRPYS